MSEPIQNTTHAEVAEKGADESVLASLGLNSQLFIFQFINFFVVLAIVWLLILKPLTQKLEERRKIIDDSIDNAKKIESEVRMAEQKAQMIVDAAKMKANAVIQEGQVALAESADAARKKTREEIELLIKQAKKNIEIDKEEMRVEIKKETVTLVVKVLEKFLGEKLDTKKDGDFIEKIIKNVDTV